jgi:hypothetical protein
MINRSPGRETTGHVSSPGCLHPRKQNDYPRLSVQLPGKQPEDWIYTQLPIQSVTQ